jgi:hypothetical protein
MSGKHASFLDRLVESRRYEAKKLDAASRRYLGVNGWMFRVFKFIFYIVTLVFTTYLIQFANVEPTLAMTFAALLITGPEGVEVLLARQGVIDDVSESVDSDSDTQ